MSPNIYFDNIIITDDLEIAKKWAEDSFEIRRVKIAEETVRIFFTKISDDVSPFFVTCFTIALFCNKKQFFLYKYMNKLIIF